MLHYLYYCFRSENPVRLGEWVEVRVSRTGRLASLEVEDDPAQEILAPGAFTQLSLPLNLYLGGAPSSDMYSPKMKTTASFVGCIQTIVLNNREVRTPRLYRLLRSCAVDNATVGMPQSLSLAGLVDKMLKLPLKSLGFKSSFFWRFIKIGQEEREISVT